MSKTKRVRITGPGIYGAPTKENPTGEIPVGTEFDIKGDMPAGWNGRAALVGNEPAEGAELVVNEQDDVKFEAFRTEVVAKAQGHIDALKAEHATALTAATGRAEKAEKDLLLANEQIDGLKAQILALGKGEDDGGDLSVKTVPELKALAESETIDLGDATKKPDIIAAIQLGREAK